MSPHDEERELSAVEFEALLGEETPEIVTIIRRSNGEIEIESDEDDDTVIALLTIAQAWVTSDYIKDNIWESVDDEDDED